MNRTPSPTGKRRSTRGLSKTYRLAGFRSGWLVVAGPRRDAADYLKGLELLANMRLCPNVPAQYAIEPALSGQHSIAGLLAPGGRLREQRDHAWRKMTAIPGVGCVKPAGAAAARCHRARAHHRFRPLSADLSGARPGSGQRHHRLVPGKPSAAGRRRAQSAPTGRGWRSAPTSTGRVTTWFRVSAVR